MSQGFIVGQGSEVRIPPLRTRIKTFAAPYDLKYSGLCGYLGKRHIEALGLWTSSAAGAV